MSDGVGASIDAAAGTSSDAAAAASIDAAVRDAPSDRTTTSVRQGAEVEVAAAAIESRCNWGVDGNDGGGWGQRWVCFHGNGL
jgi:hypothetical protein